MTSGTETVAAAGPRPAAATRSRSKRPDLLLSEAVEVARATAVEAAEQSGQAGSVGDRAAVVAEGDRVVTHQFTCTASGYRGWRWSVTLARAPRSKAVSVSEVCLLPGEGALLAPSWLPWADRLRPGDVSAADALPRRDDDPWLEPGYTATGDDDADRLALWELGLGRLRVLSRLGRGEAATRWYDGDRGPHTEIAQAAGAPCSTCGYWIPLSGAMRLLFGACANEWSPEDSRVVSADHGCGAHSETDVDLTGGGPPPPVLDELGFDPLDIERSAVPAISTPPGAGQEPDADTAGTLPGDAPQA